MSIEDDAKEAVRKVEDAYRERTSARVAWYMAFVIGVVCALFGFILGHIH